MGVGRLVWIVHGSVVGGRAALLGFLLLGIPGEEDQVGLANSLMHYLLQTLWRESGKRIANPGPTPSFHPVGTTRFTPRALGIQGSRTTIRTLFNMWNALAVFFTDLSWAVRVGEGQSLILKPAPKSRLAEEKGGKALRSWFLLSIHLADLVGWHSLKIKGGGSKRKGLAVDSEAPETRKGRKHHAYALTTSSLGHVESRCDQQGPPCKVNTSWVTDSEVDLEGRVKRKPHRGVKMNMNRKAPKQWEEPKGLTVACAAVDWTSRGKALFAFAGRESWETARDHSLRPRKWTLSVIKGGRGAETARRFAKAATLERGTFRLRVKHPRESGSGRSGGECRLELRKHGENPMPRKPKGSSARKTLGSFTVSWDCAFLVTFRAQLRPLRAKGQSSGETGFLWGVEALRKGNWEACIVIRAVPRGRAVRSTVKCYSRDNRLDFPESTCDGKFGHLDVASFAPGACSIFVQGVGLSPIKASSGSTALRTATGSYALRGMERQKFCRIQEKVTARRDVYHTIVSSGSAVMNAVRHPNRPGVADVVAEIAWLRNLLRELHSPLSTATLVYCDNVSAVYMSTNPVQHQRTKHIEIDIHFVQDMLTVGQVRVLHVPSRFQYADIFIKGLPSALFEEFRSSLSVRPPPAPTAGAY
ncbi:ribonuclease H-like domain-containing protein [Tanacetum coccineum]